MIQRCEKSSSEKSLLVIYERMAKAKDRVEAVNIVTKDGGLGSPSKKEGLVTMEADDKKKHSIPNTSDHSKLLTLEEMLYSLDSQHNTAGLVTSSKRDSGKHNRKLSDDEIVLDTADVTIVSPGTSGKREHVIGASQADNHTHDVISSNEKQGHSDDSEGTKIRRSRLKDPAVLDLDAFLNDDSDLDEMVSIEDLETRRRLLDIQLQRRIEQYYLDDLDLESLTADDFAADFRLLGSRNFQPPKPDYPQGEESEEECWICFEVLIVQKRWCCHFPVCNSCMDQYLEIKVNGGIVKISCINDNCSSYIHRDEIFNRLSREMKEKFYRFLVNANEDPQVKTCPKCSHVYNEAELGSDNQYKYGQLVVCPDCKLNWCFRCHAPWHAGVKCKEFKKGDKLVKQWAKEQHFGVNNAQKCPKCKIFIERKGGCDHMTCTRCNTGFCYRCGDRYRDFKIFGNHLSRYSIVGCKYNYMPNHPMARRLCRGSIFGAELLGGVVLLGLGIAAAGVLLGASALILPAFGGYKYHKRRKIRRRMKRQEELFKMRTRNALVEMQRERAVLERYTEKLHQQTGSADTDMGLIHVGIQTERSQKVDVTVHSPSVAGASINEQTVDSRIRMNITDDRGQVTVTTAEITHNTSKGEGSEAEVVLHVRTTYTSPHDDASVDNDKQIRAGDDKKMLPNSNIEALKEERIPHGEGNMPDKEKQESSHGDSYRSSSHTKHSRTASLPAKTDSLKSKESMKSNSGKQNLRRSDRSRKNSKNKDFRSSETDPQAIATGQVNPDQGEAFPKHNNEKTSDDQEDNIDNEALYQSGCFLKLFSKKLNTLQNQLGKEKEKMSLTRSLSEPIDYTNCPDLVSCIIASELKNRENKEEIKEQDRDHLPVQQAEGIVAKETCSTSF